MRPIEIRFDKNINNLTLVREADTKRQMEYVTVTILGALFVLGLLFYGWQHYQHLQYGYKIGEAQVIQEHLIQKRNVLRLDRERLRNPTRIATMAKEQGMVQPVSGQLVPVYLESNSQLQLSAKK